MLENRQNDRQSGNRRICGTSPARKESDSLVRGSGKFVADIRLTDVLHLAFVRSPLANAEITDIDLAEAIDSKGVFQAYCGRNVTHLGRLSVNPVLGDVKSIPFPVLANGHVSAVGQPVAAVIANSLENANDACELVAVDFGDECVNSKRIAPAPNSEAVFSKTFAEGNSRTEFRQAAHIVEVATEHPRLAPSPMENRAVAVEFDAITQTATVWLSTQTPHRARKELADILSIDITRLHVIAPDVGGAFGLKASIYPEEVFTVWAAFELQRSIKWIASRSEDFLSASHGRGLKARARLAIAENGKFLALEAQIEAPLGCWLTNSSCIPAWNTARILPGPYNVENYEIETSGHQTDTAAIGIYRGAGRPEAAMIMERLVEDAARLLEMDPIKLRELNILQSQQLPFQRGTDVILDSGNYPLALTRLCEIFNYRNARFKQQQRRKRGEIVGIGIGFFVEPCGTGWESAAVRIDPDGTVTIYSGGSSQGQSRETAYAQIAADILGCTIDRISVICGDTKQCPVGIGALASRSTAIGGSAVAKATMVAYEKAGRSLNPDKSIECSCRYEAEGEAWGYGCYMARVSIDIETGDIEIEKLECLDDAGLIVNPSLIEGQIYGGIAQGLGAATMESLIYDETGQLLTGSLMDYAIARATDMPEIGLTHLETPSPQNILGAKGIGEAGTIGAPVAIYNAAIDALAPMGIKSVPLPLNSRNIWHAINSSIQGEVKQS